MEQKINNDEAIVICQKAINNWGQAMQKVVAIEELSELIIALSAALIKQPNNIEEETADVEIMCLQLRLMYGSSKVSEKFEDMVPITGEGIIERTIKICGMLQQSISKTIREEKTDIYFNIALVEKICETLRKKFNGAEIEEIKQEKLKRLKGVVW